MGEETKARGGWLTLGVNEGRAESLLGSRPVHCAIQPQTCWCLPSETSDPSPLGGVSLVGSLRGGHSSKFQVPSFPESPGALVLAAEADRALDEVSKRAKKEGSKLGSFQAPLKPTRKGTSSDGGGWTEMEKLLTLEQGGLASDHPDQFCGLRLITSLRLHLLI